MNRPGRSVRVVPVLAAAALLLPACTSGGNGSPGSVPHRSAATTSSTAASHAAARRTPVAAVTTPPGTGRRRGVSFDDALASLSDTDKTVTYIEYSDFASLRTVGVIRNAPPPALHTVLSNWDRVAAGATGGVDAYATVLPKLADIDLYGTDTAILVAGQEGGAVRLAGRFDQATVTTKLRSLGGRTRSFDGHPGLSFGPDDTIDRTSKLAKNFGYQNPYPQYVVTPSQLILGTGLDRVVDALPGVPSSNSAAVLDLYASCLGDVVAAAIGGDPDPHVRSAGLAVGVRRPTSVSGPQHEVLCALPKPGQHAKLASALRTRLRPTAADPFSNTASDHVISATRVEDDGPLIRVTLTIRPGSKIGYLLTGVDNHEDVYWEGGCTAAQAASRSPEC